MIGFPIGLLYANGMEWVIHKYLLHGRGKYKDSFWAFHWHAHHNKARTHDMYDDDYEKPLFRKDDKAAAASSSTDGAAPSLWERINGLDPQTKEVLSLLAGAALHAPLFPVAPFFTSAVWLSAANYYRVHKKSHLDTEWAKQKLPWHVDHHMGKNQHSNWCVTYPLFDWILGTREKYLGTPEHAADVAREEARKKNAAAAATPPVRAAA